MNESSRTYLARLTLLVIFSMTIYVATGIKCKRDVRKCKPLNWKTCEQESAFKCHQNRKKTGHLKFVKKSKCPLNCKQIKDESSKSKSGIYRVWPTYLDHSIIVYCDMDSDGGGWTVFQRRTELVNNQTKFKRDWKEYKNGFGNIHGEFWLGNDAIFAMSNENKTELLIEMSDFQDIEKYARYDWFQVLPEIDEYKLEIRGFKGDVADSLSFHNNKIFRTIDRNANVCTKDKYFNGWWFGNPILCFRANLNGIPNSGKMWEMIVWENYNFGIMDSKIKRTEMKMRPKT